MKRMKKGFVGVVVSDPVPWHVNWAPAVKLLCESDPKWVADFDRKMNKVWSSTTGKKSRRCSTSHKRPASILYFFKKEAKKELNHIVKKGLGCNLFHHLRFKVICGMWMDCIEAVKKADKPG